MITKHLRSPRLEQLEGRLPLSATVVEHEGIGYFASQSAEPGFARYDIPGERWLDRIVLVETTEIPTAAHIDDDGIYVAFGSAVYRYNLDGTGRTHVINTQYAVQRLHTDGDLLFINQSSGLYARVVSLDKNTNTVIDTIENYIDSIFGSSIAPESNRIFGRTSGISPADISYVSYTDEGLFLGGGDSPYHGTYPSANQTWVFGNGSRVVDSSGTVYSTALEYVNSFPTEISDIAFVGGEVPIVLFEDTVTAYSLGLLPTGDATLSREASDVFVNDESVIAFTRDGSAPDGWIAEIVPLTDLSAPDPGEPLNPEELPFTPDDVEVTGDGTVLLFSKQHQTIFRYDSVQQTWGETIPVMRYESPLFMAYSATSNAIYLAYNSGLIGQIDLDEENPAEVPIATLPQTPLGLSTAGEFVFAADPSGAWVTHYTFAPDGTQISAVEWNYRSSEYIWSEVNRKMYFFRDDTSPNDLLSEDINEDGSIGEKRDSPLHSSAGFVHPIRVAPDGSVVVLGSGVVHDANTLARLPQALANSVSDIAWLGSEAFTIRTIAGVAQLQAWSPASWGQTDVAQLQGTAASLVSVAEDRLLAITVAADGVPKLTVIDSNLNIVPRPTPVAIAGEDIQVDVGSLATLDGSGSFDPDNSSAGLTFNWSLLDGPEAGEFGSPQSATTTFSANSAGAYEIQLTVSDGEYQASDTILVTYRINMPPVPDASSSQTQGIAGRGPVTLSSMGTTDPNGDPFSVEWSVIDTPQDADWTLSSATSPTAQLEADTPGDYTVQLAASDGVLTGATTVIVTFAENGAPDADASLSQITAVAGRRSATLDARASSDPEEDALRYLWEVVSGPAQNASIPNAHLSFTSFFAAVPGVYEVRLTVDDGLAQDSTTFAITVVANQPPIADASRSVREAPFGTGNIRLDATASRDPDDVNLNYLWRVVASSNDTNPTISGANGSVAFLNPLQPGVYAIQLWVSDGALSDSQVLLVTVLGNQAPSADASLSDSVVVQGAEAWLDATRSFDPDGDVLSYAWSVVASSTGAIAAITDAAAPRTQLSSEAHGSFAVQLTVSDGSASATDIIIVTVREAVQQPLVGDYNGNGLVEQGDLDLVLSSWGREASQSPAQWIGPAAVGLVDQNELDAVISNWGAILQTAAAESRHAALQELEKDDCFVRDELLTNSVESQVKRGFRPRATQWNDPLTVRIREEAFARYSRAALRNAERLVTEWSPRHDSELSGSGRW